MIYACHCLPTDDQPCQHCRRLAADRAVVAGLISRLPWHNYKEGSPEKMLDLLTKTGT